MTLPKPALALLLLLSACQSSPKSPISKDPSSSSTLTSTAPSPPPASRSTAEVSASSPGKISDLSDSDLRDVLAYLDKSHHDKMKLAFWVSTPLLRSADPVFKTFYEEQGKKQKDLADQLESYAKSRHIDITYHYGVNPFGQGQKIMEERQEKTVRADDKDNFGRDMLIDELQDYEFTISLITATLPHIQDPALKTYLETSLHTNEAADLQVKQLLKRYKFN